MLNLGSAVASALVGVKGEKCVGNISSFQPPDQSFPLIRHWERFLKIQKKKRKRKSTKGKQHSLGVTLPASGQESQAGASRKPVGQPAKVSARRVPEEEPRRDLSAVLQTTQQPWPGPLVCDSHGPVQP